MLAIDMYMPESCGDCKFCRSTYVSSDEGRAPGDCCCILDEDIVSNIFNISRPKECPLIDLYNTESKGLWIYAPEDFPYLTTEYKRCSRCRARYPRSVTLAFRYCPNCGAYMRGEE